MDMGLKGTVAIITSVSGGIGMAATQELTPTERVTLSETNQRIAERTAGMVSTGHMPSRAPNPVATPLPPLKRSQSGNMCPHTAAPATASQRQASALVMG